MFYFFLLDFNSSWIFLVDFTTCLMRTGGENCEASPSTEKKRNPVIRINDEKSSGKRSAHTATYKNDSAAKRALLCL